LCDNIVNGLTREFKFVEFLDLINGVQSIYKTVQIVVKTFKLK
jgi:hypothetical protein